MATQVYLGVSTATGDPNLLVFGVILHIVLAVPLILASYLGVWVANRTLTKADQNQEFGKTG